MPEAGKLIKKLNFIPPRCRGWSTLEVGAPASGTEEIFSHHRRGTLPFIAEGHDETSLIKRLLTRKEPSWYSLPLKSHLLTLSPLMTPVCWRKHIQRLATSEVRPLSFPSQMGSNTYYFHPQSISTCILGETRFMDHKPLPLSVSLDGSCPCTCGD